MAPFGYHGSIAHLDLTTGAAHATPLDEIAARRYAAGDILATKILLDETRAGAGAFDPANRIVLSTGLLGGHPYPGLARFTIVARSPLTRGIGEARGEGPFAAALKASGADALVLAGRADVPSVVVLERGQARLVATPELAGLTVNAKTDALEARFGAGIEVAAIGPAGERLVRFASVTASRTHQAARGGLGAVFGSKQLLAVVVVPGDLPAVADPARLDALAAAYRQRLHVNPLTAWQVDPPGFAAWGGVHGDDTALPIRNYTRSLDTASRAFAPAAFLPRLTGTSPCPGCPNDCIKIFTPTDASGLDPRAGGIHQEITGSIGINLQLGDIDAMFVVNHLCSDLGLDPVGLGFTLSMAFEAFEHGLLGVDRTGEPYRFGDPDLVVRLTRAIAAREGFGDVLAEGAMRAASEISADAAGVALHVKGAEMVPFEPRTQTNLALGYATAAVGPRYDYLEHDWDFDTRFGWPHTMQGSRALEILERIDMEIASPEKVRNFKALATLWSAQDALGICQFAGPPTRAYTVQELGDLLAAITGWEASTWEVMRLGERRLHLMRVYNQRQGLGAADDTLPARFFDEPIADGGFAGTRLDRAAFADAVRSWYRMMGWDDAGRPRWETLVDHHLTWCVDAGHAPRV